MKKTNLFIFVSLILVASLYGQHFGSSSVQNLVIISWLASGIIFSTVGIFIILFGQMVLAIKEIAINTRQTSEDEKIKKEDYHSVGSLVPILKIIGILIIIAGWLWPFIGKYLF